MIANIFTVAEQVLILFILIGIGFITNKAKIFTEDSIKKLTDFMLYVVTPAVIINSFNRELDFGMLKGFVIVFILAVIIHFVNAFCAYVFIHDRNKAREKVLRTAVVFSNCGYMSFPLQNAILGTEGVFYGTAYVAVFNILLWTLGEGIINNGFKFNPKKIFLNPGIIGTVVGLIIFLASIKLPDVVATPVKNLADLNTPVAMIIIGFHLANATFKLKHLNEWITLALRLIISPLIMIVGMMLIGIKGDLLIVCAISTSAPVAAAVTMFSNKYNADTPLSASITSISTIISIVTMPVIIGIAQCL